MSLRERIKRLRAAFQAGKVPTEENFSELIDIASTPYVKGMIMMFSGKESDIPEGWKLCNGSDGTPNLVGRFILGANRTDRLYYNVAPTFKTNGRLPLSGTMLTARTQFETAGKTLELAHLPSHSHQDTMKWGDVVFAELSDDGVLQFGKGKGRYANITAVATEKAEYGALPPVYMQEHWAHWINTPPSEKAKPPAGFWRNQDAAAFTPISLIPYNYTGADYPREKISTKYHRVHTHETGGDQPHGHAFSGTLRMEVKDTDLEVAVPYYELGFIMRME